MPIIFTLAAVLNFSQITEINFNQFSIELWHTFTTKNGERNIGLITLRVELLELFEVLQLKSFKKGQVYNKITFV